MSNEQCPICGKQLGEGEQLISYFYAARNWWVVNHLKPAPNETFKSGDGLVRIPGYRSHCGLAGFQFARDPSMTPESWSEGKTGMEARFWDAIGFINKQGGTIYEAIQVRPVVPGELTLEIFNIHCKPKHSHGCLTIRSGSGDIIDSTHFGIESGRCAQLIQAAKQILTKGKL